MHSNKPERARARGFVDVMQVCGKFHGKLQVPGTQYPQPSSLVLLLQSQQNNGHNNSQVGPEAQFYRENHVQGQLTVTALILLAANTERHG